MYMMRKKVIFEIIFIRYLLGSIIFFFFRSEIDNFQHLFHLINSNGPNICKYVIKNGGIVWKTSILPKCQIQFHTTFCPCLLEIINSTIALRQKKRFCTQGFCPMSFLSLILTAFVVLRSGVDQVLSFSMVIWSELGVKNLKCIHFERIYWNRLTTETVGYIWYWCKRNIPFFLFSCSFCSIHSINMHIYFAFDLTHIIDYEILMYWNITSRFPFQSR